MDLLRAREERKYQAKVQSAFTKSGFTVPAFTLGTQGSLPSPYVNSYEVPKPLPDDGTKVGTIKAFRWFSVADDVSGRPLLESVSMDTIWMPREVAEAHCDVCSAAPSDHAHGGGYGCGIYAVKALEHWQGSIPAEVELWGRIVEHEHGYRAQFARITAILGDTEEAQQIAERYGVEVKGWRTSENPSGRSSIGLSQQQLSLYAQALLRARLGSLSPPYLSPQDADEKQP